MAFQNKYLYIILFWGLNLSAFGNACNDLEGERLVACEKIYWGVDLMYDMLFILSQLKLLSKYK